MPKTTSNRPAEVCPALVPRIANATVRLMGVELAPIVTCALDRPPRQLLVLCE
jgi:hypothetical protein